MCKVICFPAKSHAEFRNILPQSNASTVNEKSEKNHIKKPIFINALPGRSIPEGFIDARPLLQRDGLILCDWRVWEEAREGKKYLVKWITSKERKKTTKLGNTAITYHTYYSDLVPEKNLEMVMPSRVSFDRYIREADFIFLAAPEKLNRDTIPGFIEALKKTGVTVDFNFPYSGVIFKKLDLIQELQEMGIVPPDTAHKYLLLSQA